MKWNPTEFVAEIYSIDGKYAGSYLIAYDEKTHEAVKLKQITDVKKDEEKT